MDHINTEVNKEVAEKIAALKNEIGLWRTNMKNVFATKKDPAILEKKLIKRVSRAEGIMILWSFVFWLTLIVAMIVIFKLIK